MFLDAINAQNDQLINNLKEFGPSVGICVFIAFMVSIIVYLAKKNFFIKSLEPSTADQVISGPRASAILWNTLILSIILVAFFIILGYLALSGVL